MGGTKTIVKYKNMLKKTSEPRSLSNHNGNYKFEMTIHTNKRSAVSLIYIYIYIYKTATIFHVSIIFK